MEPKKIAILVVLLIGLVFVGQWSCKMWKKYNPTPTAGTPYQSSDTDTGAPAKAPATPAPTK